MALKGAKAHVARLRRLSGPEMERQVTKGLFAGAEAIAVEAQLSITRGAVSGRNHVPSKPGEAPKNDTGFLAGFIEANMAGQVNQSAYRGAAGGGVATVRLELSGDIDARIQSVSAGVAVEVVRGAAPTLIDASARETTARLSRPRI
ncbi:hypothetical protein [Sandaracinobacter sp.]|uniref:hypothetical protein n=1 Tax=Sandaracinobacter sp. TaxID=2487581 RepID=UPI0035B12A2D